MIIDIKRALPIPIAEQIAGQIREAIASGKLLPGARLPSVRQIAAQAKTSIFPVAQAFQRLEREGLVKLNHGGGAYVSRRLDNPQKIIHVMFHYPNTPDLLAAFRKQHPEYLVIARPCKVINADDLARFRAGLKSPDIVSLSSEEFCYLAGRDFLTPLEDDILPPAGRGALPNIQETFCFRGRRLAAAIAVLPFILLARRSMLENSGAALPAPDWKGADLLALIRRLTRDADGDGVPEQYGYLITSRSFTWFYLFHAFGGNLDSRQAVSAPASRAAVALLWEAIFKQQVAPRNIPVPMGQYGDMLVAAAQTARVGLMLADLNALRQCKHLFPDDLVALRSPLRYDGRRAALAAVHGAGIPRTAVCREGALVLLKFLQTPEAQDIICRPNNLLAVDPELWPAMLSGEREIHDLLLAEMRAARPMHYTETPQEMFAIQGLLEQLVSGFLPPAGFFEKVGAK